MPAWGETTRGRWTVDTVTESNINNQDTEDAIAVELEAAVRNWPGVDAVLIRGHGLYVWASSWQAAKVEISLSW